MLLQSFEELVQNRKDWVELNRKNNFHDGIKRLLTELYPDNAHFIYELLQNAEDAHAKTVRFTLTDDAVEFEHDGDRLFNLKDVESITSIGTSTKSDDPTSIGKFGVGFKAVFAYTNTPEIHSGDYHFRIRDLVIPEIDGVTKANVENRETRFIFPFDHSKKRPVKAVAEIERGLRALGDNALLFLNHIHKLEYLLPEGSLGSFERINHKDEHIEIRSSHPNSKDTISHWLRFEKVVEITDENGESKSCRIAIAYRLDKNDSRKNKQKKVSTWKISPLDHGQVSIFFPAEKETSNLKFHLHAPFASTVARDSVRDCEANDQLRDCLAELVVESLADIRDKGMLTMGFLSVLPNPMDNLSPFYEPVSSAIVQAFKSEKLTPTRKGGHAPVTELYRGPKKIDDVLGVDGLSLLTNGEPRPWAANPPQQNQRDAYFLDSLEIDSWEWWDLSWALSHLDEDEQEILEAWVAQKDDAWVMRFYALLGEACDTHDECTDAESLRIVRVGSEQGDKHVLPKDAFFSPEEEINFPDDILLVKPSVYKSKTKKQYARLFLEEIGVRDFDERAAIELMLSRYASRGSRPDSKGIKYYQDLRTFVGYWKKNPADVELFQRHTFLLGASEDETLYWSPPERLCVDAPYMETGLSSLLETHRKKLVWEGYKEYLMESQLRDFIDFLKAVGVMHTLVVECVSTKNNPYKDELRKDYYKHGVKWMYTATDKDYSISDIEKYLMTQSIPVSRLIWNTIIQTKQGCAVASFRPNRSYNIRSAESQLVYHLKRHTWIPDKSGVFRKPQDVTKENLRIDFPYDDRGGLLTAIGFGEDARKRSEEYVSKNNHAKELGFDSADDAAKLARLAKLAKENGKSPDELLEQFCPTVNQPLFPEHSVANPERREERFAEQLLSVPEKKSELCTRQIRVTKATQYTRNWLKNKYTNDAGQMVCQICQKEMPFKKRNAEYYFEAVEIFTKELLPKEHEAQFLALCPLCAAMYKEFIKKDKNAQADLKMELSDADDCDILFKLGEQEASIRFVETHFHDLKVILADL